MLDQLIQTDKCIPKNQSLHQETSLAYHHRNPLSCIQTPGPTLLRTHLARMARTVVLQVSSMDDMEARGIIEECLLSIKGVISFTFEMKTSRVTVRLRDWLKAEVSLFKKAYKEIFHMVTWY